jgi:hypothetical protein
VCLSVRLDSVGIVSIVGIVVIALLASLQVASHCLKQRKFEVVGSKFTLWVEGFCRTNSSVRIKWEVGLNIRQLVFEGLSPVCIIYLLLTQIWPQFADFLDPDHSICPNQSRKAQK